MVCDEERVAECTAAFQIKCDNWGPAMGPPLARLTQTVFETQTCFVRSKLVKKNTPLNMLAYIYKIYV